MSVVVHGANTSKEDCTVYVSNIDITLPEDEFRKVLQEAGAVLNVHFFPESDQTRQCVVQFDNSQAAQLAVLALNNMNFGTRLIRAQTEKEYKSTPSEPGIDQKSMANLPTTITGPFLSSVGKVVYVKFSHAAPGANSRYAFVEFADSKAANDSHQLSGRLFGHMPIKVGRAMQPIVKPERVQQQLQAMGINRGTNAATMYGATEGVVLEEKVIRPPASRREIMRYVRAHVDQLEEKHGRRPQRTSRSRSPPLKRALRTGAGPTPQQAAGMVWDGFQWHAASAPAAQVAVEQEQKMMPGAH
ncbi:MAG: hypothetical protein MHM6MM_008466 [Cercozoa sp. M6MM]